MLAPVVCAGVVPEQVIVDVRVHNPMPRRGIAPPDVHSGHRVVVDEIVVDIEPSHGLAVVVAVNLESLAVRVIVKVVPAEVEVRLGSVAACIERVTPAVEAASAGAVVRALVAVDVNVRGRKLEVYRHTRARSEMDIVAHKTNVVAVRAARA